MPFANIKIPEGFMSTAQKADLIHGTTDLLVSYFGEGARPHTMVLVADGGYGRADAVLDRAALERLRTQSGPTAR